MPIHPLKYYTSTIVAREIASFLENRWAALQGEKTWIRWAKNRPLTVTSWREVVEITRKYAHLGARSWYGSIEKYRQLETRSDVEEKYEENVAQATLFIDIDLVSEERVLEDWKCAIRGAREIVEAIRGEGVEKSIHLVWSGAGVHVRIHENAFRDTVLEVHPVKLAHIVAEYILEKTKHRLAETIRECNSRIKIENIIAPKRVFTAPLSLHRHLDLATVAFTPEEIDQFTINWANPANPRHNPQAWRRNSPGEADDLAGKALRKLAGKPTTHTTIPPTTPEAAKEEPRKTPRGGKRTGTPRNPGRFPVMALLQAARYYLLQGDIEKAKSWGLNRAIFYAWAKYHGAHRSLKPRQAKHTAISGKQAQVKWSGIGSEKAMLGPSGWYMIGGAEQKPEDFDRQVARKFEEAGIEFEKAWKAALEYLRKFPRRVLEDPQLFYSEVYEPVRDRFIEKVLKTPTGEEGKPVGLEKWLRRKPSHSRQRGEV